MPNHWLFKSEPEVWSWEQQKAKGKAGEEWTGVRNYQARNNMRAMKLGDRGFFYHSNDGRARRPPQHGQAGRRRIPKRHHRRLI